MRRRVASTLWVFVLSALAALGCTLATSSAAVAAPDVWVDSAADGTLVILGDGWRPEQQLSISMGPDRFLAYVDSAGGFEVATGLALNERRPVAIRHVSTQPTVAASGEPHPLAVLFARALASGMARLALVVVPLGALWFCGRAVRRRGYPPDDHA